VRKRAPAPQHRKRRHRVSKPLKVTPPLGQRGYVFPVVGESGYGDTYGAFRSDVHGKWHHGDDIFAAFGTPVVAVASGTVNRVGWRKAGGWRLWVRDRAANHFYYAHLAGYASTIFHSKYVEAGQVIGFVGNTGDAFPGAAHLHFEIHPHQLLRLRYDGAVNPTTYLDSWTRLDMVRAPRPKHPRLPRLARFRRQAEDVFHRLLVARDLLEPPTRTIEHRSPIVPVGLGRRVVAGALAVQETAATRRDEDARSQLLVPVLAGLASLALFGTAALAAVLLRARFSRGRFDGAASASGETGSDAG
jgi:Peptidase family M23